MQGRTCSRGTSLARGGLCAAGAPSRTPQDTGQAEHRSQPSTPRPSLGTSASTPSRRCSRLTQAVAGLVHAGEVVKGARTAVVDVGRAGRLAVHLPGVAWAGGRGVGALAGSQRNSLSASFPACPGGGRTARSGTGAWQPGMQHLRQGGGAWGATHRASALGAVGALPLRLVGAIGAAS